MLKSNFLDRFLTVLIAGLLAACALAPAWHWEKKGGGEADYSFDEAQCKAKLHAGTDGMVTKESVRRMQACMEAKGWSKVAN